MRSIHISDLARVPHKTAASVAILKYRFEGRLCADCLSSAHLVRVSWAGAGDLLTSLDLLPSCLTTPRVRSSTISVLPGISQATGRLKCLHAAHSCWRKRIFHVDTAEEQKGHYLLGNVITGVLSAHFISTLKYNISLCRKKSWINPHLDPYSLSVPQEGSRVAQAHRGARWPVYCEPGSWKKRASYSEAVKYPSGLILLQSTQIRNGLTLSWEYFMWRLRIHTAFINLINDPRKNKPGIYFSSRYGWISLINRIILLPSQSKCGCFSRQVDIK